jgi:plastocyanin
MKSKAIVLAVACGAAAGIAHAGPEKITYPADYLKGTLYATVDRADIKQYRELYASPGVVEAVRKGKPIPSGAVLTLVQWSVHTDDKGNPLKGPDGRFIKKDITGHTVMQKRTGWGTEYPPELRNGEWEYSAFAPDGRFNPKPNYKACFECHKPHEKMDYVISLAKLSGTFPGTQALAKAPKGEVNIISFAFAPARISTAVGKALSFLNSDDSPHQITVQGAAQKTAVLLRGQTGSITFDKAGSYNYLCGLHPTMKGVIEVR